MGFSDIAVELTRLLARFVTSVTVGEYDPRKVWQAFVQDVLDSESS